MVVKVGRLLRRSRGRGWGFLKSRRISIVTTFWLLGPSLHREALGYSGFPGNYALPRAIIKLWLRYLYTSFEALNILWRLPMTVQGRSHRDQPCDLSAWAGVVDTDAYKPWLQEEDSLGWLLTLPLSHCVTSGKLNFSTLQFSTWQMKRTIPRVCCKY